MSNEPAPGRAEIGGVIISCVLVAAGAFALMDSAGYRDPDSAAFPRTVASALIIFAIIAAVRTLIGKIPGVEKPKGSVTRRIAVPVIMLAGAAAMPWIGFLAAMLVTFFAILIAAMHEQWTSFRILVYPLAGAAIVIGFYALFRYGFLVPLPDGKLF